MRHDLNEIRALLHIPRKGHGPPGSKPLGDAAMKALETWLRRREASGQPEPEPTEEVAIDNGKENLPPR